MSKLNLFLVIGCLVLCLVWLFCLEYNASVLVRRVIGVLSFVLSIGSFYKIIMDNNESEDKQ